jgi:hypothetical protein
MNYNISFCNNMIATLKEVKLSSLIGCGMMRIPHCLENWPTGGSAVVSLMHQLHSNPHKHFLFMSVLFISVRGLVRARA